MICSSAFVSRCTIVFLWSRTCSSFESTGSSAIAPEAAEKASSATSCTGAVMMNGAFGRWFSSSAVSISSAPFVVFEFFFGTRRKSSRIIRSRVDRVERPEERAHDLAEPLAGGLGHRRRAGTSARRSLLKTATARSPSELSGGRSGTSGRPTFSRVDPVRAGEVPAHYWSVSLPGLRIVPHSVPGRGARVDVRLLLLAERLLRLFRRIAGGGATCGSPARCRPSARPRCPSWRPCASRCRRPGASR
jgi:hypothetical protein